jgi:elongation factor G
LNKEATKSAVHRETYKNNQGRGKLVIVFKLEPADEVEGKFQKDYNLLTLKGGNVPKEYIPSVEKGFRSYENRSFGWLSSG